MAHNSNIISNIAFNTDRFLFYIAELACLFGVWLSIVF